MNMFQCQAYLYKVVQNLQQRSTNYDYSVTCGSLLTCRHYRVYIKWCYNGTIFLWLPCFSGNQDGRPNNTRTFILRSIILTSASNKRNFVNFKEYHFIDNSYFPIFNSCHAPLLNVVNILPLLISYWPVLLKAVFHVGC